MSLRTVRILLIVLIVLEGALLIFGPQAKDHLPAVQEALATKEKPDWWDDAALGVRYAAWINLALLLALLATAQWWARPLASAASQISNLKSQISSLPRWFWPAVLLAAAACLALRLPLASKSLWWDESWVVYQVSHGKWRPDTKQPGKLKFQAHDWKRCAFYYQKPTNHVPMALAQKTSLSLWSSMTGAPKGALSELAARAPALLASCAAVVLLALLLAQWGFPGAGVAAALLLAAHPWHIRYGVDARAYALVVPLCLGGLLAVTRLFQTRGVAVLPWVAWGAVEFVWLWAYPNAALDVAVLNLVIAGRLLWDKEVRWKGMARLAITNVCAAMAFVQMFLPNLMQATRWAGNETVSQPLNLPLLYSTLSQMFFGTEYSWPQTPEAAGLVSSHPDSAFYNGMLALSPLMLVLAFRRWKDPAPGYGLRWLLVLSPVLSAALFMLVVWGAGSYFYPRFIIAALPCVIAFACLIVTEAVFDRTPFPASQRNGVMLRRIYAIGVTSVIALRVLPLWYAQTQVLVTRPYAPLRDVAEFVTAEGKAKGDGAGTTTDAPDDSGVEQTKDALLVCYGHGYETLPVYLPTAAGVVSRAELEKFITQAKTEKRALLVVQGHTGHNRGLIPDGFTLLDDRNVFEEVKAFAGIDPEFYYRVYRLR